MEIVRAGTGHGADDTSRREPVRRGVVARDHQQLGEGFSAETESVGGAGRGLGVIVYADAVETVAVLLRPGPGDGQLRSEPAITTVVPASGAGLCTGSG